MKQFATMFFESKIVNLGYYNVSELVLKFFNIKRYGIDFQPVNITVLDDNFEDEYFYALIIYIIFALIVFVLLKILMIVACCTFCTFRRKSTSNVQNKFCLTLLIIVSLISALTFGIGLNGLGIGYSSFDNICNNLNTSIFIAKEVRNNSRKNLNYLCFKFLY